MNAQMEEMKASMQQFLSKNDDVPAIVTSPQFLSKNDDLPAATVHVPAVVHAVVPAIPATVHATVTNPLLKKNSATPTACTTNKATLHDQERANNLKRCNEENQAIKEKFDSKYF
ncbi:hypothetical protein L2E82_50838 [Cichorium intybus]|nr:hypothetical protein L2E82_50838 [Cichorium intybus]